MWFLYLKKFFIIITGQSTLFNPKTQEFVRAILFAFCEQETVYCVNKIKTQLSMQMKVIQKQL